MNEPSHEDKVIEILTRNPLLAFSVYTHSQVSYLEMTAQKIEGLLEDGIDGNTVQGSCFSEVYGLFWLWVLGAYEVVRTMSQNRDCFDEKLCERLSEIKRVLRLIRIPFAKQELPRWNRKDDIRPVFSELSVTEIDPEKKDFLFLIENEKISIKSSLGLFRTFVSTIEISSIKKKIPTGRNQNA